MMAGLSCAIYFFLVFISNVFAKPNIVIVLSDDQDLILNGMIPMKSTIQNVANNGVTFENYFVNSPICCPSRSSLLTGQYAHNTGVWNNSVSGGCASDTWRKNHEPHTIAALLHADGYRTFYAGKYLNQYGTNKSGKNHDVPVGWDHWYGLIGNSKYYNYSLSENGKLVNYTDSYLTDVIRDKAVEFLRLDFSNPIFMILAVPAPHAPATPAARHSSEFPTEKAVRTPSFNTTTKAKHWLLRQTPIPLPSKITEDLDNIQRHRLQSLLSVDELVSNVIHELRLLKQFSNTYFIFTSDNGYHIGQFSQPWDKRQPYETDVRVPLLISGPGIPSKSISPFVAQTVDLAPTLLDMAGLKSSPVMDGQSFLPHIKGHSQELKNVTNVLIEYHGEGNAHSNDNRCPSKHDDNLAECGWDSFCKCQDSRNNTYSCIRQLSHEKNFLFCRFSDKENFVEAYDMKSDKYQLNNIFESMKKEVVEEYMSLLDKLVKCQGSQCRQ